MKNSLFAIIIITVAASFLTLESCRRPTVTPTTDYSLLLGKWTMKEGIGNYTVQGQNRKDTTRFVANDYFNFKAEGTVLIFETTSGQHDGNWRRADNKLIFTNTNYMDSYITGWGVTKLTAHELELYYTETNSVSTLEQKLTFTR